MSEFEDLDLTDATQVAHLGMARFQFGNMYHEGWDLVGWSPDQLHEGIEKAAPYIVIEYLRALENKCSNGTPRGEDNAATFANLRSRIEDELVG